MFSPSHCQFKGKEDVSFRASFQGNELRVANFSVFSVSIRTDFAKKSDLAVQYCGLIQEKKPTLYTTLDLISTLNRAF